MQLKCCLHRSRKHTKLRPGRAQIRSTSRMSEPSRPRDPVPASDSANPHAAWGRARLPQPGPGLPSPAGGAGRGGARRQRASFPRLRGPVSPAEPARKPPPAGWPAPARGHPLDAAAAPRTEPPPGGLRGRRLRGQRQGVDPEQGRAAARALTLPRTSRSLPKEHDQRGCRGAAGR